MAFQQNIVDKSELQEELQVVIVRVVYITCIAHTSNMAVVQHFLRLMLNESFIIE